ncbi:histidine phosphatase family protein [Bradyrhizobium japonicum]|uniref:histidine phosphatase family protein n=1 Tax=Bradyrhizobium japonicum TaxID=375 RepID=UPI001BAB2764|nr:histidine phosphatase family protein [Bradyrhizobium japonicum]MBR0748859.1 histidine phosphatase family protein [Bradyrhizobium japonicum]
MRKIACIALLAFLAPLHPAGAVDTDALVSELRGGGYVIMFRHGATDDSRKDVYPLNFTDMTAQRQLSANGREMAADVGRAVRKLGIPIGLVLTSKLNRAVETGKLLSSRDVQAVDALTDSGGSASAMANPGGANRKAGAAVRDLVNTPPSGTTGTLLVTHKTNFADAFGKDAGDVQEGEAFVYKPDPSGQPKLVARVKATDWIAAAK